MWQRRMRGTVPGFVKASSIGVVWIVVRVSPVLRSMIGVVADEVVCSRMGDAMGKLRTLMRGV